LRTEDGRRGGKTESSVFSRASWAALPLIGRKAQNVEAGGAESGASGGTGLRGRDPELLEVVGGWGNLSAPLKAAILALLRSTGNK